MMPMSSAGTAASSARERSCYNCSSAMTSHGIKNGLYVYVCPSCKCMFEVYEPK
ncbi:MAG: hypothetical protein PHG85_07165 [Candidatus Altiarchaeota archaeon]|nr:hypothetical protein [Candidatus Altiarchaeota archaeon]